MKKKIVAIMAIMAVVLMLVAGCGNQTASSGGQAKGDKSANLKESLAVDSSSLKSSDRQTLLLDLEKTQIPPRPADPQALPETDAGHWYDLEYAGWSAQKVNLPKSPADGAKGKKVITIINGDHPYLTAYTNGQKTVAAAYGIDLKVMSPNWNIDVQNQMIDQAINAKPDMIILIPDDAKVAVQQLRKINQAGIPVISSNMLSEDEGMKYSIGWTGPNDWGQFRMLARSFADKLNKEGGYAIIRHAPGGSPFFARTFGVVTELQTYAPNMQLLDMQAPGFDATKSMQVVSDWITKYGSKLKGIVLADDSAQLTGAIEAIKKANRKDIVLVAAGNSKVGMDAVKSGDAYAITYQSAEADGAVPLKLAIDWFNGKQVEAVRYLPKHIITQADVDKYMPAQW